MEFVRFEISSRFRSVAVDVCFESFSNFEHFEICCHTNADSQHHNNKLNTTYIIHFSYRVESTYFPSHTPSSLQGGIYLPSAEPRIPEHIRKSIRVRKQLALLSGPNEKLFIVRPMSRFLFVRVKMRYGIPLWGDCLMPCCSNSLCMEIVSRNWKYCSSGITIPHI